MTLDFRVYVEGGSDVCLLVGKVSTLEFPVKFSYQLRARLRFLGTKRTERSTGRVLLPVFFAVHRESGCSGGLASLRSMARISTLAICCATLVSAAAAVP